jgi:DNA-binding NarL/FixJ family response regulator
MINIILADHQRIFRVGLASVLAAEDDIRIVSQPHSVDLLLHALQKLRTQVLVLSSAFLSQLHEIKAVAIARQTSIMLLLEPEDQLPAHFAVDIQGVIRRPKAKATLAQGVRHLALGGEVPPAWHQELAGVRPDAGGIRVRQRLSFLERRITAFVIQGYRNAEIAVRMGMAEHEVKDSLSRIFEKTGVYDRLELALFMLHHHTAQPEAAGARPLPVLNSMPAIQFFRESRRRMTVD